MPVIDEHILIDKRNELPENIIAVIQTYDETVGNSETEVAAKVENQTEMQVEQTETYVSMVWIPQSGAKYHSRSGCSNMKNPSQVTLDQAISWGYDACKRCH